MYTHFYRPSSINERKCGMSFSDVGITHECSYRLSLESGVDIELERYLDPISGKYHLRVPDEDLATKAFEPLVDHVTSYLNSARKPERIRLDRGDTRRNHRYGQSEVREHMVVLVSDTANARIVLQPTNPVRLCCQVTSSSGVVAIPNTERYETALGRITQSIPIPV